ncbi:unnamed protein product [Paramecium sonneborni]|uniref:Uncharacterized protein n=1 Tax=Paramecium sonneborni TaxID=65129 RepID=A0A8S1P3V0_9CILI|nr:unnamed protein product [Paramecium sonneborni]
MHEDEPLRMAKHISDFIFHEKIPLNSEEIEQIILQEYQTFNLVLYHMINKQKIFASV